MQPSAQEPRSLQDTESLNNPAGTDRLCSRKKWTVHTRPGAAAWDQHELTAGGRHVRDSGFGGFLGPGTAILDNRVFIFILEHSSKMVFSHPGEDPRKRFTLRKRILPRAFVQQWFVLCT